MAERLVLHVGLMKSGTSFLQQVMLANRETLLERGVLFPGPRWRRQVFAVREVIEHGAAGQPPLPDDGTWNRLVKEIAAWPGTAVVSMEFLASRRMNKIQQIRDSIPVDDVHVVITARDLSRTIGAMWQESVKNWAHVEWEDYLAAVRREDESEWSRAFWKRQAVATITERWMRVLGRDNVTLLTVPQAGSPRDLLWRRFAQIVPVDPEGVDLQVRANNSLDLASVMMLRSLNERLRDVDPAPSVLEYHNVVKNSLVRGVLAARGTRGEHLGLNKRWVRARGEAEVASLLALDPQVVGSLEELRCQPVPGTRPSKVSPEKQLDAALDALTEAVHQLVISRREPSSDS